MNAQKSWTTISGSVLGTSHSKSFSNNQDSIRSYMDDTMVIGIVADGCSAKNDKNAHLLHNEVGSNILADITLRTVRDYFVHYTDDVIPSAMVWDRITSDILAQVKTIIALIGPDFTNIALRYFQSTLVGYIITPSKTVVFGCGDGVYGVNEDIHIIHAAAQENYPPYLIYSLLKTDIYKIHDPAIRLHELAHYNTQDVQTIFVGTDGVVDLIHAADNFIPGQQEKVGNINQYWKQEVYQQNPFWLQNKLHSYNTTKVQRSTEGIMTKIPGLLHDDTSLVASIKKPPIIL